MGGVLPCTVNFCGAVLDPGFDLDFVCFLNDLKSFLS